MPQFFKRSQDEIALIRFFNILWRRLGRFAVLNLIYTAVLLPIILPLYSALFSNLYNLLVQTGMTDFQVWTPLLHLALLYFEHVPYALRIILLIASLLFFGPMKAGMTYVIRNYAIKRHSWISEVWEKACENLKQGLIFGILDFTVWIILILNLSILNEEALITLIKWISVIVAAVYGHMRRYLYLMLITMELSIWQLIKNAWIFSRIKRNWAITAANTFLWIVSAYLLVMVNPFFEVLFILLFNFSFTNYLTAFACYPMIEKYMVKPAIENKKDKG